ncbi:hypothetical protein HDU93_009986 [Gonapodya sp. JEL0774]|nr:hypothetical protein HDU93_009986 [Gonapodya sp. JEL0774]
MAGRESQRRERNRLEAKLVFDGRCKFSWNIPWDPREMGEKLKAAPAISTAKDRADGLISPNVLGKSNVAVGNSHQRTSDDSESPDIFEGLRKEFIGDVPSSSCGGESEVNIRKRKRDEDNGVNLDSEGTRGYHLHEALSAVTGPATEKADFDHPMKRPRADLGGRAPESDGRTGSVDAPPGNQQAGLQQQSEISDSLLPPVVSKPPTSLRPKWLTFALPENGRQFSEKNIRRLTLPGDEAKPWSATASMELDNVTWNVYGKSALGATSSEKRKRETKDRAGQKHAKPTKSRSEAGPQSKWARESAAIRRIAEGQPSAPVSTMKADKTEAGKKVTRRRNRKHKGETSSNKPEGPRDIDPILSKDPATEVPSSGSVGANSNKSQVDAVVLRLDGTEMENRLSHRLRSVLSCLAVTGSGESGKSKAMLARSPHSSPLSESVGNTPSIDRPRKVLDMGAVHDENTPPGSISQSRETDDERMTRLGGVLGIMEDTVAELSEWLQSQKERLQVPTINL